MRVWIVAFTTLILLAACDESGDGSAGGGNNQAPPTVTVATPVNKKIVEDDEFVGRFEAVNEVDLRARIGGYLDTIHFVDGTKVEEGDLLFTIYQRPFLTSLRQAESSVKANEASFNFAQQQLERAEQLLNRGNISRSVVDERRESFLSAQSAIEGSRAALERARLDLEYTEIRAPISGRIGRRLISVGNLIEANASVLTTIVSVNPIYFYFDIN